VPFYIIAHSDVILSPSSPDNQPVLSINNCIDWLLCNSIWREIISPSSHKNQPVLSINKNCVGNQLLFDLIQKEIFSPSSHNNQPIISINNYIDWVFLNSIWIRILLSSPSNKPDLSIIDWIDSPFLNSIQRGILPPSSHNNQPVQSINKCIDQWLCNLITNSHNNQLKQNQQWCQLTISLLNLSAVHFNNSLSSCNYQWYQWQPKGLFLSNVATLFNTFFKLLINIYHGVQKENLTFPWISIKFYIACGTFSTGYNDTEKC